MSKSFGTKFILINEIQQKLPPEIFGGGPWLHIATILRGFKEYCCFKHIPTDKVYIEEVHATSDTIFKQIKDPQEWQDLYSFLQGKGVLAYITGKEIKIAKKKN